MRTGVQIVYLVIGLLSVLLLVFGLTQGRDELAGAGFIGGVIALAVLPVAIRVWELERGGGKGGDLHEVVRAVREMSDRSALSDDARRVLNRDRERELLRRAIREDISKGDWDAALVLVEELAERFGYREDAEGFRAQIAKARSASQVSRLNEAVGSFDRLIADRKWDEAEEEAQRVARLFPDEARARGLVGRVPAAQEKYKNDLERRFLVAAEQERIDEAMELLREMDHYLTREEAEAFQETARGVVGKARENLGVRFKLAVQDRRWTDAAQCGEQIIAEFPNSKMAEEIRGMIDVIRERAMAMR